MCKQDSISPPHELHCSAVTTAREAGILCIELQIRREREEGNFNSVTHLKFPVESPAANWHPFGLALTQRIPPCVRDESPPMIIFPLLEGDDKEMIS